VGASGEVSHLADPVEHGTAHPVIREGLKAHAPAWVESVLGLEQSPESKRH
jgi:hypothetical protein